MVENLNPEKGVLGKEIEKGGFEFLDMSLSSFNLRKVCGVDVRGSVSYLFK